MAKDMEMGFEGGMDAPAHQVPAMAEDEDQGDLVLELMRLHQIQGDASVASKMNPGHGQKKWGLPYWILVGAASVIILLGPKKDQLFRPPELAMFAVILCAICLILRAMSP